MIQKNHSFGQLFIFTTIGIITTIVALQKIFTLLLQKSLFFCQTIFNSISLFIPQQLQLVIGSLILIFTAYLCFRYISMTFMLIKFKNKLIISNKRSQKLINVLKHVTIATSIEVVVDRRPIAFCFGLINPKIYISDTLLRVLKKNELKAVIAHENYHIKNFDVQISFFFHLIQPFAIFFPILTDMYNKYQLNKEINADNEAILSTRSNDYLFSALKKLIAYPSSYSLAMASINNTDTLEVRIKKLAGKNFVYKKINPLNTIISLVIFTIFMTINLVPVKAVEVNTGNSKITLVCLNNEKCLSWCKNTAEVRNYTKNINASSETPLTKN